MGDNHGIAIDHGLRPVPLAFLIANLKMLQGFAIANLEAVTYVVKLKMNAAVLDLVIAKQGAGFDDVPAILVGEGPACQAVADVGLVHGVDVVGFADVIGDDHAGFGQRQSEALMILQDRPGIVRARLGDRFFVVGQLHPEVAEVVAPLFAPILDFQGKEVAILRCFFELPCIGLTLIPDHPANREPDEWMDHAVPDGRRLHGVHTRFGWHGGLGRPVAAAIPLVGALLPAGQPVFVAL